MVFFFLAYFMSVIFASLKITMVTYAILGVIIAVIYSQLKRQPAAKAAPAAAEGMMDEEDDDDYDDGF